MPAEQRGSAYRTASGWGVRWREHGARRFASGFRSRTAALNHYRDVVLPRLRAESTIPASTTLADFVELYLQAHAEGREASTIAVLRDRLNRAVEVFGGVPLADLERRVPEIAAWRAALAEGSRYGATQALRQALDAAVRWGVITSNPAKRAGPNPAPKRAEVVPFTSHELERLVVELGPYGSLVRFAAATGLRPCEWAALERRDVRRDDGVVLVERSWSRGRLAPYGKTARSRRRVPLSRAAMATLDSLPSATVVALKGPALLFPAPAGGYLDLHNFRAREWRPALEAAGVPHRAVYALRHTFATNALAAGLGLYELARFMGTSVELIDETYGHLARGAEDVARAKLDALSDGLGV